MKNLSFKWIVLSLCLFNFPAFSQSNLVLQNPHVEYNGIVFFHVFGPKSVSYLEYQGRNARSTTNAGETWLRNYQIQDTSFSSSYPFFTSSQIGFLQHGGKIFKTSNGGISWKIAVESAGTIAFNKNTFLNDSIGYGYEIGNQVLTQPPILKRTTDGGLSWTTVTNFSFPQNIPNGYNLSLDAVIDDNIFLLRTNTVSFNSSNLLITKNRGQTWNEVPKDLTQSSPISFTYVYKVGKKMLVLGADSLKYNISKDGGETWFISRLPNGTNEVNNTPVFFLDTLQGWFASGASIYKTNNGGINWIAVQNLNTPTLSKSIGQIEFWNSMEGFSNIGGIINYTSDGGSTWAPTIKGNSDGFNRISFQNDKTIWLGSYDGFKSNALKSTNKGKNWGKANAEIQAYVQFISASHGFSWYPGFKKTTNSGRTWKNIATPAIPEFCKFFDKDTGVFFTQYNKGYKTTDGGNTWNIIFELNEFWTKLSKVEFVDKLNWFLVLNSEKKDSAQFYRTKDAGASWKRVGFLKTPGLLYGDNISSFSMPDTNTAYIINWFYQSDTSSSGFMRSLNGGKDWAILDNRAYANASFLKFISPTTGFYFLPGKGLFKTTNYGQNWELYDTTGKFSTINDIWFENGKPKIMVGNFGTIFTDSTWSGVKDYVVSGEIRKKANNNCTVEPNESPLSERLVVTTPGEYYSNTNDSGKYFLEVPPGSYSIRQIPESFTFQSLETQYCPPNNESIVASTSTIFDTSKANTFINEVKNCPILVINQDHFFMRPCQKSRLKITIINKGNLASTPETLFVKFPSEIVLKKASSVFTFSSSDSIYRFILAPIQPESQSIINIVDSIICNPTVLTGQTLCVRTWIDNTPPCLFQSPNWNGADLEVASRCLTSGQTRFNIRNKGNAMPTASQYQIFIDSALVYQNSFQLAANNTMNITLPANAPAGFARLVVPQSANHPLSTFASAQANCATGISTNGMFPPPDQSPLVDIECVTVTNAYDPNDKQVFPTGWGTAGNVEPETEFTYKIRFQNTGTDTAFKVVLVDTLDANLDIASLQIGAGSHPFTFKVSGKARPVLTWTFDNILLPDSNRNEEKSNGFVNFSIRPKAGLSLGTKLENFADIYFDFNDPIRTNTTVNTLWRPTYTPGILDTVFVTEAKRSIAGKSFKISPNPALDVISIQLPEGNTAGLEITDLQGKSIKQLQIISGEAVSIKDLKPGIYIMKLEGYRAERLVVKP